MFCFSSFYFRRWISSYSYRKCTEMSGEHHWWVKCIEISSFWCFQKTKLQIGPPICYCSKMKLVKSSRQVVCWLNGVKVSQKWFRCVWFCNPKRFNTLTFEKWRGRELPSLRTQCFSIPHHVPSENWRPVHWAQQTRKRNINEKWFFHCIFEKQTTAQNQSESRGSALVGKRKRIQGVLSVFSIHFFCFSQFSPKRTISWELVFFFVVFFHYYYIAFVSRYNIAECLLRFLYVSNDPPCYFRRRRRLPRVLTPVFNSSSRAVSTSSVTRASWRPSAPARVWIVLSGSSRS